MLRKLTGCPDVRRGSTSTGPGCHHCLHCSSASCCANTSKLRGHNCLSMLLFIIFLRLSTQAPSQLVVPSSCQAEWLMCVLGMHPPPYL